ncbi:kelch-like protein 31 [Acanthaster planci]|uniref:Kelch-like protein 31 n=1 Tax=Acanthaster planci TaxID=133434 RepID=A0A8B7YFI4_ACAPL|nr:kelch-like protein 31 [Acanthaster planci]
MNNLSPRTESNRTKLPPPVLPKPFVTRNGRKLIKDLTNAPASMRPTASNADHGVKILQGLELQRGQGLLCDTTLVAGNCRFRVHRAVLAASSGYFWDLFNGDKSTEGVDLNIREGEREDIVLDRVEPDVLEGLVQYMYTGLINLEDVSIDSVRKALGKWKEYRVTGLERSCVDILSQRLHAENCIRVYLTACENNLEGVRLTAEELIIENLSKLMTEDSFLRLDLKDLLVLVSSPYLKLKCRLALHSASQKWLDHDVDRMRHAEEVRGQVLSTPLRLVLGDTTERANALENIRKSMSGDIDQGIQNGTRDNALWVTRTHPTQPVILAFGGEDRQGLPSERVYQLHPSSGCCEPFHAMPIRRLDLALTAYGGQVFVAGGQYSSDSHASDSIGTVHCFDPKTESWRQMHPMLKRRALFTLSTIGDRIYAVGGKNAQGSLASVECFDPAMNEWSFIAPLVIPTFGHASAVHDGRLYTTGGVVIGKHFTNSLQCYDPTTDIWSYRCPMGTKRALHMMCAVGDHLYVLGGNTRNERGKRIDCDVVERYSFETDQWVSVNPIPRPVCLAGVTSLGHRIYLVGGYNGRLAMRHGDIQCYDTLKNKWTRIGQLPEPLMRLSTCTLSLPIMQHGNAGQSSANQRSRSGSTGHSDSSSEGSV